MEKESKLSPAVQALEHKHLRRQTKEPLSTSPLFLPNPYGSEKNSMGGQSIPKLAVNRGDGSRSHGYLSSRRVRESSDDVLQRDRSTRDTQAKLSKNIRTMAKSSMDAQKKGFRGARSASNLSKPTETNVVPFEVKMADFPELVGFSLPKTTQKEACSPSPSSLSPQTPKLPSSVKSVKKGSPLLDSQQTVIDANLDILLIPSGQPAVTSWANIASQPPKKPVPNDSTTSSNHMQDMATQREDGAPGKKKRKKKKKAKSTGQDVDAESQETAIPQEPPKFEDEEEFPGLALALTDRLISNRKLCSEEIQREGGQNQSADQNKKQSSASKTPTEAAKKGQKAAAASGKKSKVPVQLDIGNMLAALEKKQSQKAKQDTKPLILSVGGGLPVVQKQTTVPKKPPWQQDKIAHNPLDSTSPLVKKGKQREVPKAKKPTPLKKVILKEREEKKQKRLLDERGLLPENESTLNDAIEEEQCDVHATDEAGSPTEGFDDQTELNGSNQTEEEGDEETDKDEITIQQQTTSPELYSARTPKIHSRKFRDYCSQMLSKDVDECVTTLLKELVRFQDRLYQKDPMKARMKRRLVMGLREVLKHLKLRKIKCVIISPNCERIQSKGGLDEALHTIIDTCREQGVPFVFALSRKALGRCVNKAVPVSLVGIFNYDGAQDYYHKMIELSSEARTAYEAMVSSLEQQDQTEQETNTEELQSNSLYEEAKPGPDPTEPEEPEYIKIWKKMLEKECNHTFLNFEERLSSMHLDSECTDNTDEDEKS